MVDAGPLAIAVLDCGRTRRTRWLVCQASPNAARWTCRRPQVHADGCASGVPVLAWSPASHAGSDRPLSASRPHAGRWPHPDAGP